MGKCDGRDWVVVISERARRDDGRGVVMMRMTDRGS